MSRWRSNQLSYEPAKTQAGIIAREIPEATASLVQRHMSLKRGRAQAPRLHQPDDTLREAHVAARRRRPSQSQASPARRSMTSPCSTATMRPPGHRLVYQVLQEARVVKVLRINALRVVEGWALQDLNPGAIEYESLYWRRPHLPYTRCNATGSVKPLTTPLQNRSVQTRQSVA
jgi:hypothetical protein